MAKISLGTVTNGQNISTMNANFTLIMNALNNSVLYRLNPSGEPNQMNNDLDFNSFNLLNGGAIACLSLTVNGVSLNAAIQGAANSAAASQASAVASEASHQQAIVDSAAQVALATTQAGIATTQAGIATTQATASAASAAAAAAAAGASGSLIAVNNLSDLPNKVTARSNLGVPLGTSGATVPLLNGINVWANTQTITPASTSSVLVLAPVASKNAYVQYSSASVVKWEMGKNTTDDFILNRYVSGTLTDVPMSIANATGIVTFNLAPVVPGLTVGASAATGATMNFVSAAGASNARTVSMFTGANARWVYGSIASGETGSNAGSDFFINRYNDAGTAIDTPLTITRSNGIVAMSAMPKLIANNTTAFSIPNNAPTVITGYTIGAQVGSNFVASTGVYTAPVAGWYDVRAGLRSAATAVVANTQIQLLPTVNGSGVSQAGAIYPAASAATFLITQGAWLVKMNAGDLLTMRAFQNSGAAVALDAGGSDNFVHIALMP